jgi:uncharacterized membrane protein YtjA (UPF0391 family)
MTRPAEILKSGKPHALRVVVALGRANSSPDRHLVAIPLIRLVRSLGEVGMRWVILFLIATVGSGLLGFGATSPTASSIGQLLFGICLIMFLVALLVRAMQKGGPARIID